ncbi:branched-chain amino acid ABC transporter permease [Muricoccus radiodurans]|uniref:branched-chain amino acid ABC transporter permease n=1 Tax=Muricoccus radiodurans TaxID=2231721 RepID=UPI003CE81B7D
MTDYLVFILVICGCYALLAQSLVVSWGLAGLPNLGLAGFFAIGGYTGAMLGKWGGWPPALALAAALPLGALAGALVTAATLRLRDDYLAIVALGFAETLRLVLSNEIWATGGTDGIAGVPSPFPRDWGPGFHLAMLGLVTVLVLASGWLVRRLAASPWGRAVRAVREDQVVAAVAGKTVTRLKLQAFAISAAIASLAGAFYGQYTSYVSPETFQLLVTVYAFLAVTAGGRARVSGGTLGAYALIAMVEGLRFVAGALPGLTPVRAASLREILVGLLLILLLRLRPEGFLPERNQKAPRTAP